VTAKTRSAVGTIAFIVIGVGGVQLLRYTAHGPTPMWMLGVAAVVLVTVLFMVVVGSVPVAPQ